MANHYSHIIDGQLVLRTAGVGFELMSSRYKSQHFLLYPILASDFLLLLYWARRSISIITYFQLRETVCPLHQYVDQWYNILAGWELGVLKTHSRSARGDEEQRTLGSAAQGEEYTALGGFLCPSGSWSCTWGYLVSIGRHDGRFWCVRVKMCVLRTLLAVRI